MVYENNDWNSGVQGSGPLANVYRASGPSTEVYRVSRPPDVYDSSESGYNSYSGHYAMYASPRANTGFAGYSAGGVKDSP